MMMMCSGNGVLHLRVELAMTFSVYSTQLCPKFIPTRLPTHRTSYLVEPMKLAASSARCSSRGMGVRSPNVH